MRDDFKLSSDSITEKFLNPMLALTTTEQQPPMTQEEINRQKLYASAVGALLWLARTSRPDIATATNFLSRYTSRPSKRHWKAVVHAFCYLNTTKLLGLKYSEDLSNYSSVPDFISHASNNKILNVYCDASFNSDLDDRKSTAGYLIYFLGCLIHWSSKKINHTTKSTMQSEYYALSIASEDVEMFQNILIGLNYPQSTSVVHEDNTSSIFVANNEVLNKNTRCFETHYHYIRDMIKAFKIRLVFIKTTLQLADIMTKALCAAVFIQLRVKLLNDK
jgi:hypothetical protein